MFRWGTSSFRDPHESGNTRAYHGDTLHSSLVFVEAAFQVRNQRDEDSGNYSTQILATHGKSPILLESVLLSLVLTYYTMQNACR